MNKWEKLIIVWNNFCLNRIFIEIILFACDSENSPNSLKPKSIFWDKLKWHQSVSQKEWSFYRLLTNWYLSERFLPTDHRFRFKRKGKIVKDSELTPILNFSLACTQECREWDSLAPCWSPPSQVLLSPIHHTSGLHLSLHASESITNIWNMFQETTGAQGPTINWSLPSRCLDICKYWTFDCILHNMLSWNLCQSLQLIPPISLVLLLLFDFDLETIPTCAQSI